MPISLEGYCDLRNIQDLLLDGTITSCTAIWRTFKEPVIPFGSMIEYHYISAEDQSRLHQFGEKVFLEIFLGYALYAEEFGKETFWSQTLRSCGI